MTKKKGATSPMQTRSTTNIAENIANFHSMLINLPKATVPIFNGNPLEFVSFIAAFQHQIETHIEDPKDLLYYLDQFTSGEPNDVVKACHHLPDDEGYDEAMRLLKKDFGGEYRIADAYMEKLKSWPPVKNEDYNSLRSFSLFLRNCWNTAKSNKFLQSLDHPHNLRDISAQLPMELRKKWRDKAANIRNRDKELTLEHLVELCESEAEKLRDPAVGNLNVQNSSKSVNQTVVKKSLSTKVDKVCYYCKDAHHIAECSALSKLDMETRKNYIKQESLCFACLNKGHRSNFCRSRRSCNTCQRRHPTILHGDLPNDARKLQVISNASQESPVSSPIIKSPPAAVTQSISNAATNPTSNLGSVLVPMVLVNLKLPNREEYVTINAVLDSGSTTSFITEEVIKELKLPTTTNKISLSTMGSRSQCSIKSVESGLELWNLEMNSMALLPNLYVRSIPFNTNDLPRRSDVQQWNHLRDLPFNYNRNPVGLLIGMDCPEVLAPQELISGGQNEPFATKTKLGWTISGPTFRFKEAPTVLKSSATNCFEENLRKDLLLMYDREFIPNEEVDYSKNERKFLNLVESSVKMFDNHYQIALPFNDKLNEVPSYYSESVKSLERLRKKMKTDEDYANKYSNFMTEMIQKNFVEPSTFENGIFIPHHGVFHPRNGKFRIVFNCSFKRRDRLSINDALYQGPDLTSSIVGVLTRFRQFSVAFTADIEKMFYQVQVPVEDRKFLKFLWYENDDYVAGSFKPYQFMVHLFGATSSPAISNFALRRIAHDFDVSDSVKEILSKSFYVDDCLHSVPTIGEAVKNIHQIVEACKLGGFNLTKIKANNSKVANATQESVEVPLEESALGLRWNPASDCFRFSCSDDVKCGTINRKIMLSVVARLYDPLGLIAPFILKGKIILQMATKLKIGWEEDVPNDLAQEWNKWVENFVNLEHLSIPRCIIPNISNEYILHTFSDASEKGYGAVSYIVAVNSGNPPMMVRSQAHVSPIKATSIPRLELQAAVLASRLAKQITQDLSVYVKTYFWTDSQTVLKYLFNDTSRFRKFVSNRIREIEATTELNHWNFVSTNSNPADFCSRGVDINFLRSSYLWNHGPTFIASKDECFTNSASSVDLSNLDGLELVKSAAVKLESNPITTLLEYFSSYFILKKRVCWLIRLRESKFKSLQLNDPISVEEMENSEMIIMNLVQKTYLNENSKQLRRLLCKLNAKKFADGLVRVGGRLQRCQSIEYQTKHQIIVPRCHVATLILGKAHLDSGHLGRSSTINQARKNGFWIIGANSLVRLVLKKCMICRKSLQKKNTQIMANLPTQRLRLNCSPFYSTGIDFFGPLFVVRGRSSVKRYGCVFTCLTTRAIHLEFAFSLDTNSFLKALFRFLNRRGSIHDITSDNGTNFRGGKTELSKEIEALNHGIISEKLLYRNISWKFNPPGTPHYGGIWEREIRTIKRILNDVLNLQSMDDEDFISALVGIESILNSRPICPMSNDPNDLCSLTPNHILINSDPYKFQFEDNCSTYRRSWKRIQYLNQIFWKRFSKEYLPTLQIRQKWTKNQVNIRVGDLVLLENSQQPRCMWKTGRVTEVYPDEENNVRTVKVRTVDVKKNGSKWESKDSYTLKSVTKMCLLSE